MSQNDVANWWQMIWNNIPNGFAANKLEGRIEPQIEGERFDRGSRKVIEWLKQV